MFVYCCCGVTEKITARLKIQSRYPTQASPAAEKDAAIESGPAEKDDERQRSKIPLPEKIPR
jgi:hypothetical protein